MEVLLLIISIAAVLLILRALARHGWDRTVGLMANAAAHSANAYAEEKKANAGKAIRKAAEEMDEYVINETIQAQDRLNQMGDILNGTYQKRQDADEKAKEKAKQEELEA